MSTYPDDVVVAASPPWDTVLLNAETMGGEKPEPSDTKIPGSLPSEVINAFRLVAELLS